MKDIDKTNEVWFEANIFWDIKEVNFINNSSKKIPNIIKKIQNECFKYNTCVGDNASQAKSKKLQKFYNEIIKYSETNKKNGFNIYYLPSTLIETCGIAYVKEGYTVISQKKNPAPGMRCNPPYILAHELGHLLSLKHTHDKSNIMAIGIMPGIKLNKTQINKALKYYKTEINF